MVSKRTTDKKEKKFAGAKETAAAISPPESRVGDVIVDSSPVDTRKRGETKVLRNEEGRPTGLETDKGVFIGLSRNDIKKQLESGGLGTGGIGLDTKVLKPEEEQLRVQQAQQVQELKQRVAEDPALLQEERRLDLNPERDQGITFANELVPIVGEAQRQIRKTLLESIGLSRDIETVIQDPQTTRQLALQEIQKGIIQKGLTRDEKYAAFLESIPLGQKINEYAGSLPSSKSRVDSIKSEIVAQKDEINDVRENVNAGLLDPVEAVEIIDRAEERLVENEQRIALLVNASPKLQADPDSVNGIEEEILRARQKIRNSRNAVLVAQVAPPSDEAILLALRDLKGERGQ